MKTIKANATKTNLFYRLDALTLELNIAHQYFKETNDVELLKNCMDNIEQAKQMLFSIRKDYPTSKSKIYVNNSMNTFIEKAIEASYILYNKTNDYTYIEKGFQLSELNRSSALVSGIQNVRFKKNGKYSSRCLTKREQVKS